MKKLITSCLALFTVLALFGQSSAGFWSESNRSDFYKPGFMPQAWHSLSLDLDAMRNHLRHAPMEFTTAAQNEPLELALPMPDGTMSTFNVWESPIMEPGLAAKFPMIKTYAGKSKANPGTTIRFSCSPQGFNAIVHTGSATVLVAPNSPEEQVYLSFWLKDVDFASPEANQFHCEVQHDDAEIHGFTENFIESTDRAAAPVDLYTYRLAVATTREYSADYGNTAMTVMDNVVVVINNVNSVFERDAAVRLLLIDNTEQVFFFSNPDPYTNGNTQEMIDENPAVLNAAFTVNGYDIGHVFGTNGGGLASLAGVCNGTGGLSAFPKARAASCKFAVYDGPLFYIIAGHEMGHQFNATHTFNSCDNENETPETGYEPGSGSTIMCYNGNGVCGNNHVQATSDPFFHINSMLRIQEFTRTGDGNACKQVVAEGNEMPVADIPMQGGFFIPKSTPFKLTGSASDVNDPFSSLTYTWEQYDLGPWSPLGSPIGTAPLFRWYPPTNNPTRIFPKIETIISNTNDIREVLPTIDRVLTFRFVTRDNHANAGAFNYEEIVFNCKASAGPFLVTYPNTAVTFAVGENVQVTWDRANTQLAPVNCQKVNIHLSTDGGLTYPTLLAANVNNSGSAFVVVPNTPTTTARIRVEAADNIFFDISNQNFTITAPTAPGYIFTTDPSQGGLACDEISFELSTEAFEGFAGQVTFSVVGPPNGITPTFTPATVNVGQSSILTLNTSGATQSGDVTIVVQASAPGLPDQTRTLVLTIVATDLTGIEATSPADGAPSQGTLPTFGWTDHPNADSYEIQIATDPGFTQIIDQASGLTGNQYVPTVTLEDGKTYYWRIRATNQCGAANYADPFAFQTASQSCVKKASSGDQNNIIIPGSGLPLITSKVNFPQGGVISDLNVIRVKGNHIAVRHLEARLKGPDNTKVVLMSEPSCNGENFNCGFDDQSPLTLTNCPAANAEYKTVDPLANFNGKNAQGDWTLELEVVNSEGEGGQFDDWELEVCAALTSANPLIIKNDTLGVPPGATNLIYKNSLEVTDADNVPADLEFTIVSNTQHGQVKLNGQALGVGDHFTMFDVYASKMTYTNTNNAALYDYFTFTVSDGGGGFAGTHVST
ncbi:MAG: proprotein convertase P-domain-containing protein [Saprospiraceae bacterium]|nr:proprotein convertase P-domain-containing protein [Saprospiraceae bacterium]